MRKLLSAPRKASQHSASEQRALSYVGSKHFSHPQRLPGSIFEQAGLNVCQLITRHGGITKLSIWSTLVSRDKPLRTTGSFHCLQKSFRLHPACRSTLLIPTVSVSCVQDLPGTISEKTTVNTWQASQHSVCEHPHLVHGPRLPRIMFGKAWLRVGSTGNSSHGTTELSMGVGRLRQTYDSCIVLNNWHFSLALQNQVDRIPHAKARCPLTLSAAYHVCRSCSEPSVGKLCGVFGGTVSKASQHSAWEQPALHFTP